MEIFLVCVGAVALGEIGDKTQILSLAMASRFKRPLPILAGILTATLANHLLACTAGVWAARLLRPSILHIVVGVSFLALAAWALVPDKAPGELRERGRYGVFALSTATFFIAEMGDKTQIVSMALAAKYQALGLVIAGTTAGIMLVNTPTVLLAQRLSRLVSLRGVRIVAALAYALLGIMSLTGYSPA